jgi:hypothetical protein
MLMIFNTGPDTLPRKYRRNVNDANRIETYVEMVWFGSICSSGILEICDMTFFNVISVAIYVDSGELETSFVTS